MRCMLMRGGTSKGAYFLADDLPGRPGATRRLAAAGHGLARPPPDRRHRRRPSADQQGRGGRPVRPTPTPTSTTCSCRSCVDQPIVTDPQNCGNILAGVGPFAIERGLVPRHRRPRRTVRIHMVNTGSVATATFPRRATGAPSYDGDAAIAGVPGTRRRDPARLRRHRRLARAARCCPPATRSTSIDGRRGHADRQRHAGRGAAGRRRRRHRLRDLRRTGGQRSVPRPTLEAIRLAAGPLMNLGDVADATVPKLTLVAPPRDGGDLVHPHASSPTAATTRSACSAPCRVATAALLPGSPAADVVAAAGADAGRSWSSTRPARSTPPSTPRTVDGVARRASAPASSAPPAS